MQTTNTPVALLTVKEAMAYLRCGRTKLYELINAGSLEVIHLGKRCVRVKMVSLERVASEGLQA